MLKAFIFDLGNVLIKISTEKIFQSWGSQSGLDWREIKERFRFDDQYYQFERGALTPAQYFKHIRSEFCLPLSDAEMETGWNAIFDGKVHGADRLLKALARSYRVVVLSNTNEPHVKFFQSAYHEVLQPCERIFVSNEIGIRKPETGAYRTVIDYLQLKPEEIVFFDDLPENIVAGRRLGIIGIQFAGCEAVIQELKKIGIELEQAS